jgi:purine nucleosidase
MRQFLIDTDPGVDDAFAILMCLAEGAVHVRALTVLGGNVGLSHTLRNAAQLADHASLPMQVYAGCARPLLGQAPDAAFVHGSDGFGQASLAPPKTVIEPEHAALAIIAHAKACAGELEILALGPLTNLALALALEPRLPEFVKRLTIMGGALRAQGNITAFAEFNIAVDPESAQSVLTRWPGAVLADWEACVQYAPSISQTEKWFAGAAPGAQFMRQISRKTLAFKLGIAGVASDQAARSTAPWAWADPFAAYVALYPDLVQYLQAGIEVQLSGPARGATLVNVRETRLHLAHQIDIADFHRRLAATVAN